MIRVSEERFNELMDEAIESIPQIFKDKIDNVVFISEPYPSDSDLQRLGVADRYSLLGLYSGVPFTGRNTSYYGVMPDRIILFQRNIESISGNEEELKSKILEVIIHELAHYFGMDEDEVRKAGY